MAERPTPSIQELQAQSERFSHIAGQRQSLADRIAQGEVAPPDPTDLQKFEKYLTLPERLASSVAGFEARIGEVKTQIAEHTAQRERVHTIYERTLEAVTAGRVPSSALDKLTNAYPYLKPQAETLISLTPEPTLTDKPGLDIPMAAAATAEPDNAPAQPEPEAKPKRERRESTMPKNEVYFLGLNIAIPPIQAQILRILQKGPASADEIAQKMYGPKDKHARDRVLIYRSLLNTALQPYGITVINIGEKTTSGKSSTYEVRKIVTDKPQGPGRETVQLGEEQIDLQRREAQVLEYLLKNERSVPVEELSLWIIGAINGNAQANISSIIKDLKRRMSEYGMTIINTSSELHRNASYQLVAGGNSGEANPGADTPDEGISKSAPEPEGIAIPNAEAEQTEKRAKMISTKEAAHIATVIKMKADRINTTLAPQGVSIDMDLMQRIMDMEIYDPIHSERPKGEEIINFRNRLIEKLDTIFTYGLEDDLFDEGNEDLQELVILLYHIDFDMLKELMNEPGGLTVQALGNHVLSVTPRYAEKNGSQGVEDVLTPQSHASQLRPRPRVIEIPMEPVVDQKPIEAPASAPIPNPEPIFSAARRRDRVPPTIPAKPARANGSNEAREHNPLKTEFPMAYRSDPEADKNIEIIIKQALERIPEFRSGNDRTVRSIRIVQAFKPDVGREAEEASRSGRIFTEQRKGFSVYSLDQVVYMAYIHGRDNLSARGRTQVKELVELLIGRAWNILDTQRVLRQTGLPHYEPPRRR